MSEATPPAAPAPYLEQVWQTLPRLLALFDRDPFSPARGMGDRLFWAWKTRDFANASFQGAAHGLARLLVANMLPPSLTEQRILERLRAMCWATKHLTRRDGSLEEAFPYESSWCVTALVAYDLLAAVELLGARLDLAERGRWLAVIDPLIGHLCRHDETHAVISNHLATGAAALALWSTLSGNDRSAAAERLIARIREHASPEGWFTEYEGADPGYQTLALVYLTEVHRLRPDLRLDPELDRACEFLAHFLHPDGSFGGVYGSRNTRFCYPAGIEARAHTSPVAAALAAAVRRSIASSHCVGLLAVDESNLVPMFNAWCHAAQLATPLAADLPALPPQQSEPFRREFGAAGVLVDHSDAGYCVVSWHKGGVCYHFGSDGRRRVNCGPLYRDAGGRLYSAQSVDRENSIAISDDGLTLRAQLR